MRLTVHPSAEAIPLVLDHVGALRIHADPQAWKAAVEVVDPARQWTRGIRLLTCDAADREQGRDRRVCNVRRIRKELGAKLGDRLRGSHRSVDKPPERRELLQRFEQVALDARPGGDSAMSEERGYGRRTVGLDWGVEKVHVQRSENLRVRLGSCRRIGAVV